MNVYEKIAKLADSKGVTIQIVEQECGLSNGSIKKWTTSTPKADRLAKVAEYFKVSVDYLLGLTEYKNNYAEWDAKYNKNDVMKNKVKEIEAVDTIAAHLEDKEITDEKIKALTQYMDLLFEKKKK